MKKDTIYLDFPIWEYYEYAGEREQFLDVYTYDQITDESEMNLLKELLLQTKNEMESKTVPQFPEIVRQHSDADGEIYLIGKNIFQKVYKKSYLTHTLSSKNEVVLTPADNSKIWFLNLKPK
jgi:hypothetical protein